MADLGSDHMIVEITVPIQGQMVRNIHEFRWTDWEEFRSKRQALSSDDPITDIEEWTQSLNADANLIWFPVHMGEVWPHLPTSTKVLTPPHAML
ncbi:hypothetical protein HPB50_007052 [Hyalomma asiaticum]|uniref:Uncharacterized protein n=1 Tax=Hyalomma asiaticum TaxID=266040 RepID=A0ACB7RYI8_HYAAI|nr:hypothetical protein HPB50_007052 [Hyalomma asiaticum]